MALDTAARNRTGNPDARGADCGYYWVSQLVRSAYFAEIYQPGFQW